MGAICPKPPDDPILDTIIAEETAIENTTPIFIGTFIETLDEQYRTTEKQKWGSDPQTNTIETQKKITATSLQSSQNTKKGILKNTNTHLQEELILLTKTISIEHSHEKLARYLKARKSSSHEV